MEPGSNITIFTLSLRFEESKMNSECASPLIEVSSNGITDGQSLVRKSALTDEIADSICKYPYNTDADNLKMKSSKQRRSRTLKPLENNSKTGQYMNRKMKRRVSCQLFQRIHISLVLMSVIVMVVAGGEANTVFVCMENSVKLFSNSSFNPEDSLVILYHNNAPVKAWRHDGKSRDMGRIERNVNNDILLNKVITVDEGNYVLKFAPSTRQEQVDLHVLEPPSARCKPSVDVTQDREIYSLIATLPKIGCGSLHDVLTWILPGNSSQMNTPILRVNSIENPGLYKVCIGGPAMKCVRDQHHADYCSEPYYVPKIEVFSTENPSLLVDLDWKTTAVAVSLALFVVTTVLVIILIKYCHHIRRKEQQYPTSSYCNELLLHLPAPVKANNECGSTYFKSYPYNVL